ncbi:hypothetical protein HRED_08980 [Candidatus Haloredivivus sp. G17]|nr:hypothetical protein HRED_08980 [Candidatus Haloredivivus sp. G17]
MIEVSTYQAISFGINVASLVVLGIIAYFQLKISRRDIEKPNLEGESYIRELRDEENEVTSFLMNVVNKGPGDARDIEIRAISFAGFFGERSPENPYTQRHVNPELVSLSKTHVGKGEGSSRRIEFDPI